MLARSSRISTSEAALAQERDQAARLAQQAKTLKELTERMEREIAAARKAAEEARIAEAKAKEEEAKAARASG